MLQFLLNLSKIIAVCKVQFHQSSPDVYRISSNIFIDGYLYVHCFLKKSGNKRHALCTTRRASPRFCQILRHTACAIRYRRCSPRSEEKKNQREKTPLASLRVSAATFFMYHREFVNAYGTVAIYGWTPAKTFGTDKSRRRSTILFVASLEIWGKGERGDGKRRSFGRLFLFITKSG